MKKIILFTILLNSVFLIAQDQALSDAEKAKILAQANNPLANMKALNFQFNYMPNLTATDNKAMLTSIRYAQPVGRVLFRATIPTMTISDPTTGFATSGLGDINLFATYLFSSPSSPTQFGAGPMIYDPTGTATTASVTNPTGIPFENTGLGANNWQLGAAAVYFNAESAQFQYGGLVTWVAGLGEDQVTNTAATENLMAIQPFYFYKLVKVLCFVVLPYGLLI